MSPAAHSGQALGEGAWLVLEVALDRLRPASLEVTPPPFYSLVQSRCMLRRMSRVRAQCRPSESAQRPGQSGSGSERNSAQVDKWGSVLMRKAAGAENSRLVDLGGPLGPEGAERLAGLLRAVTLPELASLELRSGVGSAGAAAIAAVVTRFSSLTAVDLRYLHGSTA